MMQQLAVFWQLFKRDAMVHLRYSRQYIINYMIFFPFVWSFAIGYIMPKVIFGFGQTQSGATLFVGSVLAMVFPLAFHLNIDLMFDLQNERHIDYKRSLISPQLLIVERILFHALATWVKVATFFPIALFYLRGTIPTDQIRWPATFLVLFLASLFCNAYHTFAFCVMRSPQQIANFWMRFNSPLIWFGGFFIPWSVFNKLSPWLGRLVLLDPLLYVTEGLRGAIIGEGEFLSLGYCVLGVSVGALVFMFLAMWQFKRRVDHV